jgi:thioredoxin 1
MMIGDWLITVTGDIYSWIKERDTKIWAKFLLVLFHAVNFIVFQLVNLIAQLRWPFSAIVRFINSFRSIPSGYPIPANETNLQKLIDKNQVVLVDFWTEWCGPCLLMEGSLKEFAKHYEGKIIVAKVDATINPKLTKKYNVMGYPTLMLFFEGNEIGRIVGSLNYKMLIRFIDYYLDDV